MSRHILVVTRDPSLDDAGDHEKCVYPEHPDDRDYSIECLPGNGCRGWESCPHPHEVNGRSAADGPILDDAVLGADGRAPWHGKQDYEFHGQMHTWRDGYGWTVEYTACIVNYNSSYDLPPEAEDLPIGRYEVDDDWDDTCCYLYLIGPAAEASTRQ